MLPASQSLYMYMYTMYLAYILGLSNVIQFYTLGYIVQTLWDNYVVADVKRRDLCSNVNYGAQNIFS